MKSNLVLLFVLTLIKSYHSLKLPSGFQKCDIRTPDCDLCLSRAIQSAIEQLKKPIIEYGLPQMEPFIAPKYVGCEFGNETMGIRQKYSNYKISGLTNIVKTDAKLDFSKNVLTVDIHFHKVTYDFDYQIVGRVIVLRVNASTTATGTMIKPIFKFKFALEEYFKDNEKYLRVVDTTLKMISKSGVVNFRNLFKSQRLNEDINAEMCEDWKEILDYWQKVLPKMFADPFGEIANDLLEKVPFKNLIDGVE